MAGPATLKIEIIADAAKAISGLGKLEGAAGKAAKGTESAGSKLGGFAKAAAAAAGAAALGGLIAVVKTGVAEQKDFLAGQAQLANGIKSTGNAAHVSVAGLESLASSIQGYSGQTDDSIVASEKLLLTFTGIHNAAGKNNDMFDQATKMTADMAAKMGGDASKYAVQLGKALNDPTKGITALTRVGVTFTEQQKKSIKSMQASGNTIGAQKVIMAELRKEFGGSAKAAGETLPGQLTRAKRSFEDVSQSLVASLMPILVILVNFLMKNVMPAFKTLADFVTANIAWIGPLAAAIAVLVGAWKAYTIVMTIVKFATAEATAANLQLAASMLTNPIFLVIAAIALLAVGLVIAYKKSQTFRNIVNAAFGGVVAAGKAVGRFFTQTLPKAFTYALAFVRRWGPLVLAALVPFIGIPLLIWQHFSQIRGFISRALSGVGSMIAAPFSSAWSWIKAHVVTPMSNMFDGIVGAIGRAMSGVEHAITAPFEAAWNWIKNNVVGPIKSVWNGIAGAINAIHFSVTIPKFIPGIGGKGFTFDPPNVPTLARGGVVDKATLAVIGEGRGREIAAPEALLRKIVAEGGGTTINIYGALDPDATARQIDQYSWPGGPPGRAGPVWCGFRGAPAGGVA